MLYNVLMISLTVAGIVIVLVSSYKISKSNVYPIGIVKARSAWSDVAAVDVVKEPLPDADVTVVVDSTDVRLYSIKPGSRVRRKFWLCPKCSTLQVFNDDYRCHFCGGEDLVFSRQGDIQTLTEHGEALKTHEKLFRDMEKRIRELEVSSVKEIQGVVEDKVAATRNEWVQ